MTIFLFIIILGVLVLVHELGHFLVAKKAGVRVDEFGFGYPPRAWKMGRRWNTDFTLNWIPFGGFVKIFGENYEDNPSPDGFGSRFNQISKKWQVAILSAGVLFNFIFAWLLLSFGLWIGIPAPVDNDFNKPVIEPILTVVSVLPNSPAEKSMIKSGDQILSITNNSEIFNNLGVEQAQHIISNSDSKILLDIKRGNEFKSIEIIPVDGVVGDKKAIGVAMDMVGTLKLSLFSAVQDGARATVKLTYLTVVGIAQLIKNVFVGRADFSQISGPVGIVGLVGDASKLGFSYIISFTALISINLAVINLVPFPALDGGRILFVIIEAIKKSPLNPKVVQVVNGLSFALLILLMLIVTYKDLVKLF